MSNAAIRKPAQQPTDRDFARSSALHSMDAVMFGLKGVMLALKPYQGSGVVAAAADGAVKATPEVFLFALANELLVNCQNALRSSGLNDQKTETSKTPNM